MRKFTKMNFQLNTKILHIFVIENSKLQAMMLRGTNVYEYIPYSYFRDNICNNCNEYSFVMVPIKVYKNFFADKTVS